jgi:tRNA pseudouridine38-40 synthase
MVRNIKLRIAYDGTNYSGWQTQLEKVTIQETIEEAIFAVTKQRTDLIGSGRTDSGVHALGQVANFVADTNIPEEKIKTALNANLPADIRILHSEDVSLAFNSRFDAHEKTYMYQIYNDRILNPFYRNYSYFVPYALDLGKMKDGAALLEGTHDFGGFMAAGAQVRNTVRTIYSTRLTKENEVIKFQVTGNGFLYNMVRIIIGTLIDIGKGLQVLPYVREQSCFLSPGQHLCMKCP